MIAQDLQGVLNKLVPKIVDICGETVKKIVLYGSVARGDDDPESDVNIAVIARNCTDGMYDQISDATMPLELDYNRMINVNCIDCDLYFQYRAVYPYYKNIDDEGFILWEPGTNENIDFGLINEKIRTRLNPRDLQNIEYGRIEEKKRVVGVLYNEYVTTGKISTSDATHIVDLSETEFLQMVVPHGQ